MTRVVELLKGLYDRVEADQKTEEDLFIAYKCWAKNTIQTKTASNEKAHERKNSLQSYISDLDNGRIELTTERVDLEREIEGLVQDIQVADNQREQEHKDYLAAKEELEQAIEALEGAIEVLGEATGAVSLLTPRTKAGGNRARDAHRGEVLERALDVGQRFLSTEDATFLQRILSGDVPEWDWKKLNRKATFKSRYEARSGDIQKTLTGLLDEFQSGLQDTERKESEAAAAHAKLTEDKNKRLTEARAALSSMALEGAARGVTKSEAQAEIDSLTTQISNDEGYIVEVTGALETKTSEWTERKGVRATELKALSEAIAVLHSDDARDLFKRSLSSQGYLLLQESPRRDGAVASRFTASQQGAAAALKRTAVSARDKRISELAIRIAAATPAGVQPVIDAIDNLLQILEREDDEDLATKESCEQSRATDTRTALTTSRDIDQLSDDSMKLLEEIKEAETEIKEKEVEIQEINATLEEARRLREDEHQHWLRSDKDDEDAAALVQEAITILKAFYESGTNRMFLQQLPTAAPGQAPLPPPPTWTEPHTSESTESKGIMAILELLHEDIEKDRQAASTSENEAAAAYTTLESESTNEIQVLEQAITGLEATKANKITEDQEAKNERGLKKGELDVILKKLEDAAPGCDFFIVNFASRVQNRQIEADGLRKAKAYLESLSSMNFGSML